ESLGHSVVGTASTRGEAAEIFKRTNPKMVLADIQLADGSSGIDAVNDILATSPIPVIFITAFPERLLTGERPEPAFLVTKPFNPEMVKALISQALFFDNQAKAAAWIYLDAHGRPVYLPSFRLYLIAIGACRGCRKGSCLPTWNQSQRGSLT